MINNLTKAAQRSAHAIPNVFLRNGIKPYLSKRKLKFLARPLYQGMDFSVTVTLTDIVFTPSETEIFGTDGFGPDRACLTHYRRLLGQIGCDAVRLDGRALMKKDGRSRIADFFRFCLLRQGEPISYVLIYPDYADGQDGGLSQHYLELSKNNAMERLSSASTISHALPRKLGIAHKDAHELIDTVLWQCNASNFIYGFTVPVNLLSSCSIEEQASDRKILKAPNVAKSTQTNINAESCEDPAKPQLITKGAAAQALDRVSHLSHEGFLSFEEVLPTIDREVTYASHPIFVGPNISISLSQEGVSVYGDMRAGKVAKAISAMCERATEKMKAFLARTMHNIGGDRVRLDARWVELNTGQRFLDVYRAVLFDRDTPYRTLPYLGQIFEDDVSKQGRMVTWLAPDTVREARKVVKDVSCAALGSSMRMMDSPQRCFEGLLWLPVNQDKYRPAFYIPYAENRLSESELSRIHLQICNNEINNFLYLKNGIPEISAKTKPPRR